MFPLLNSTLQKALLADEVGRFPSLLIKTIGVATILCSIFYSDISKLAHFNEAHILLPTFPAGQIEKKKKKMKQKSQEVCVIC